VLALAAVGTVVVAAQIMLTQGASIIGMHGSEGLPKTRDDFLTLVAGVVVSALPLAAARVKFSRSAPTAVDDPVGIAAT
jgi:hypothetical protein